MIARNSEELIKFAATYGKWSCEQTDYLIKNYVVITIGLPTEEQLFITVNGDIARVDKGVRYVGPSEVLIVKKRTIVSGDITCTMKVSDIYEEPVIIPDGYVYVDFRQPRYGENFITRNGIVDICILSEHRTPYIIIKRV